MPEWTEKWPTEPGWHWFYGWCWAPQGYSPEMHLVKVRWTGNDNLFMVTDGIDGYFLYEEDGAYGVWLPVQLPEPPPDFEEHEQQ